ncbi:hypothetical protein DIPPA_22528 [Diplonema papillatum]|nr:hypothetical protein DIPPA_22528 [Diplonema papillatum]
MPAAQGDLDLDVSLYQLQTERDNLNASLQHAQQRQAARAGAEQPQELQRLRTATITPSRSGWAPVATRLRSSLTLDDTQRRGLGRENSWQPVQTKTALIADAVRRMTSQDPNGQSEMLPLVGGARKTSDGTAGSSTYSGGTRLPLGQLSPNLTSYNYSFTYKPGAFPYPESVGPASRRGSAKPGSPRANPGSPRAKPEAAPDNDLRLPSVDPLAATSSGQAGLARPGAGPPLSRDGSALSGAGPGRAHPQQAAGLQPASEHRSVRIGPVVDDHPSQVGGPPQQKQQQQQVQQQQQQQQPFGQPANPGGPAADNRKSNIRAPSATDPALQQSFNQSVDLARQGSAGAPQGAYLQPENLGPTPDNRKSNIRAPSATDPAAQGSPALQQAFSQAVDLARQGSTGQALAAPQAAYLQPENRKSSIRAPSTADRGSPSPLQASFSHQPGFHEPPADSRVVRIGSVTDASQKSPLLQQSFSQPMAFSQQGSSQALGMPPTNARSSPAVRIVDPASEGPGLQQSFNQPMAFSQQGSGQALGMLPTNARSSPTVRVMDPASEGPVLQQAVDAAPQGSGQALTAPQTTTDLQEQAHAANLGLQDSRRSSDNSLHLPKDQRSSFSRPGHAASQRGSDEGAGRMAPLIQQVSSEPVSPALFDGAAAAAPAKQAQRPPSQKGSRGTDSTDHGQPSAPEYPSGERASQPGRPRSSSGWHPSGPPGRDTPVGGKTARFAPVLNSRSSDGGSSPAPREPGLGGFRPPPPTSRPPANGREGGDDADSLNRRSSGSSLAPSSRASGPRQEVDLFTNTAIIDGAFQRPHIADAAAIIDGAFQRQQITDAIFLSSTSSKPVSHPRRRTSGDIPQNTPQNPTSFQADHALQYQHHRRQQQQQQHPPRPAPEPVAPGDPPYRTGYLGKDPRAAVGRVQQGHPTGYVEIGRDVAARPNPRHTLPPGGFSLLEEGEAAARKASVLSGISITQSRPSRRGVDGGGEGGKQSDRAEPPAFITAKPCEPFSPARVCGAEPAPPYPKEAPVHSYHHGQHPRAVLSGALPSQPASFALVRPPSSVQLRPKEADFAVLSPKRNQPHPPAKQAPPASPPAVQPNTFTLQIALDARLRDACCGDDALPNHVGGGLLVTARPAGGARSCADRGVLAWRGGPPAPEAIRGDHGFVSDANRGDHSYLPDANRGNRGFLSDANRDHAYLPDATRGDHAYLSDANRGNRGFLSDATRGDHAYLSDANRGDHAFSAWKGAPPVSGGANGLEDAARKRALARERIGALEGLLQEAKDEEMNASRQLEQIGVRKGSDAPRRELNVVTPANHWDGGPSYGTGYGNGGVQLNTLPRRYEAEPPCNKTVTFQTRTTTPGPVARGGNQNSLSPLKLSPMPPRTPPATVLADSHPSVSAPKPRKTPCLSPPRPAPQPAAARRAQPLPPPSSASVTLPPGNFTGPLTVDASSFVGQPYSPSQIGSPDAGQPPTPPPPWQCPPSPHDPPRPSPRSWIPEWWA